MATTDELSILGLMNLPRIAAQTVYKVADRLVENGSDLGHLLEYDAASLIQEEILPEPLAEAFVSESQRRWRDSVINALLSNDIELIAFTSERYPEHLRQRPRTLAPPLLMVAGKANLLHKPGIAIAGARKVSPAGADISRQLAHEATRKRFTVIAGGAKGTDTHAHDEALSRNGNTIMVLAEGIITSSSRRLIEASRDRDIALISTFLPHGAWQTWRAMARNHYILGLSDRLIVVEAGQSGGTLAIGKGSLKHEIDTWVLDHAAPPPSAAGNLELLELGARAIPVDESNTVTIPDELFAVHNWSVEVQT